MDGELRTLFRQHLPKFHWVSIETWPVSSGVPDSNYCAAGGVEGWVEFKKISGWKIPWKQPYLQVAWLERRSRTGGRCFLAVRRNQALYVFRGSDARRVLEEGIRGPLPVGMWEGGPSHWDWARVGEILTEAVYKPS